MRETLQAAGELVSLNAVSWSRNALYTPEDWSILPDANNAGCISKPIGKEAKFMSLGVGLDLFTYFSPVLFLYWMQTWVLSCALAPHPKLVWQTLLKDHQPAWRMTNKVSLVRFRVWSCHRILPVFNCIDEWMAAGGHTSWQPCLRDWSARSTWDLMKALAFQIWMARLLFSSAVFQNWRLR